MKKFVAVLIPALLLSGCASLWKTMGVATTTQEAERERASAAQIAEVRRLVEELQAKAAEIERLTGEASARAQRVEELEKTVAELAATIEGAGLTGLKAQVDELRERANAMPDETLRRLVEILTAALAGR